MQAPPPLPDTVLRRVIAIARADGWGIVVVATLSSLYALAHGQGTEAAIAALVAGIGAAELHGGRLLQRGALGGIRWLVAAQLCLLVTITAYAWWRWQYFNAAELWATLPGFVQAELDRQLLEAGLIPELDRPLLLQLTNSLVCLVLVLVTLIYQGGLAIYYTRRRHAVADALGAKDSKV